MSNLAKQALDALDTYGYEYQKDGDAIEYLKAKGYEIADEYDLQDTIYGNPQFQKTNERYVFTDGSLLDEEFEVFDSKSDFEDQQMKIAEDGHEKMTAAFHAGDSGFVDPETQADRIRAHEEHQALKGSRPTIDQTASVDQAPVIKKVETDTPKIDSPKI